MPTFLIIGGGIGGLAAALCLRARGLDALVYEQAPQLREIGAAISIWPNASRILQHLGILDKLLARSHVPPAGALRDAKGRVLMRMVNLKTDVPAIFAHRADVHAVLLDALPSDLLHLNKRCTGIERDGPLIRAAFSDNTFSPWAGGLIGADGIHSVIRDFTLHDGTPTYRGYLAWRGVTSQWKSPYPETSEEIVGETWGRGQRFGFIPLGNGRTGWWATANFSKRDGDEVCKRSKAAWKIDLLKRFRGWHAPIPALIDATPEPAFLCTPIADRPTPAPPRPWGEGPITLLGDAAHPTTPNLGQGGCMAIEDAAVLAQSLAAIPHIPTALRVYEMTRFDRTAHIVRESLNMGRLGQWSNPLACALRNALVKLAPTRGFQKQLRDLWTYDAWNAPLLMHRTGGINPLAIQ